MQVITKMESQVFQLSHQQRVTTRGYLFFGGKTCLLRKMLKRVTKLFCLLRFNFSQALWPVAMDTALGERTLTLAKLNSPHRFIPLPACSAAGDDFINSRHPALETSQT